MGNRLLKNKPLVEAILETKWKPVAGGPNAPIDPQYRVFMGRFYDRVSQAYPAYEALQTAAIPEEMSFQMPQYRFRTKENEWPLIQLGPGVLTLNETNAYEWNDFEKRANWTLERLFESYPGKLELQSLLLRYINAVEIDYSKEAVTSFLREKMKIGVTYPESLFQCGKVDQIPAGFVLQTSFLANEPKGIVQIKFSKGKVNERPVLLWDTSVMSRGNDLPELPAEFPEWVSSAHLIAEDWFFKLIDGELLQRFQGVE